jgi:hypothetical protein
MVDHYSTTGQVFIKHEEPGGEYLSPEEARQLGERLIKNAEHAEGDN